MSDSQSISHNSEVFFKVERMSYDEECTRFKEDQCEGDQESLEVLNTFQ